MFDRYWSKTVLTLVLWRWTRN